MLNQVNNDEIFFTTYLIPAKAGIYGYLFSQA